MTDLTIEEIKTGNVKVRVGYETRILATDLGGTHPVCIAFKANTGWKVMRLNEKGKPPHREDRDSEYDLVRIPQPRYFNIYTDLDGRGDYAGCMSSTVAEAEEKARRGSRVGSHQTYKYLHGEVTKVETEGDE